MNTWAFSSAAWNFVRRDARWSPRALTREARRSSRRQRTAYEIIESSSLGRDAGSRADRTSLIGSILPQWHQRDRSVGDFRPAFDRVPIPAAARYEQRYLGVLSKRDVVVRAEGAGLVHKAGRGCASRSRRRGLPDRRTRGVPRSNRMEHAPVPVDDGCVLDTYEADDPLQGLGHERLRRRPCRAGRRTRSSVLEQCRSNW